MKVQRKKRQRKKNEKTKYELSEHERRDTSANTYLHAAPRNSLLLSFFISFVSRIFVRLVYDLLDGLNAVSFLYFNRRASDYLYFMYALRCVDFPLGGSTIQAMQLYLKRTSRLLPFYFLCLRSSDFGRYCCWIDNYRLPASLRSSNNVSECVRAAFENRYRL